MKKVLTFIAVAAIGLSSFAQQKSVGNAPVIKSVDYLKPMLPVSELKPTVAKDAQYTFTKKSTSNAPVLATWTLDSLPEGFVVSGGWKVAHGNAVGAWTDAAPLASPTGNTGYLLLNTDSLNCTWAGNTPTAITDTNRMINVNASVATAPLRCDTTTSMVIEFYHKFRPFPNKSKNTQTALSLAIRTYDTVSQTWSAWKDITTGLRHNIQTNEMSPVYHEIFNVTSYMKDQDSVQFQFNWANGTHYFWMIDDITVREANAKEMKQTDDFKIINPYTMMPQFMNVPFGQSVGVGNLGYDTLSVTLTSTVDGQTPKTLTKEVAQGQSQELKQTFYTTKSTDLGTYNFNSTVKAAGLDSTFTSNRFDYTVTAYDYQTSYEDTLTVNAPYGKDAGVYYGYKLDPTQYTNIPTTYTLGVLLDFFPDAEYRSMTSERQIIYGIQFVAAEGTTAGSKVDAFFGKLSVDGQKMSSWTYTNVKSSTEITSNLIETTGTTDNPNRSPKVTNVLLYDETQGNKLVPVAVDLPNADTSKFVLGYTVTGGKVICGSSTQAGAFEDQAFIISAGSGKGYYTMGKATGENYTPMIRVLTAPGRDNPISIGTVSSLVSDIYCSPNPASSNLNVTYTITKGANVDIAITDMLGRTVASKNEGRMNQGSFMATIPVSDLANGTYVVTVKADNTIKTSKLVIRK